MRLELVEAPALPQLAASPTASPETGVGSLVKLGDGEAAPPPGPVGERLALAQLRQQVGRVLIAKQRHLEDWSERRRVERDPGAVRLGVELRRGLCDARHLETVPLRRRARRGAKQRDRVLRMRVEHPASPVE